LKRFAIFISLHLFLFLLVIAYQAQSSEWTIDRYKTLSYARNPLSGLSIDIKHYLTLV